MSSTCRLNISYRSMTGIFWYSRHRDQAPCYAVTPEPDKYLTEGLDTLPQLRDCSSQLTASRTRRGGQSLLLAPSYFSRFSTHTTTSGLSNRIAVNTLRKFQVSPTQALRNFTNETNRFTVINEQEKQLEIVLRRSLLTTASK